jgi:hypothetical protein
MDEIASRKKASWDQIDKWLCVIDPFAHFIDNLLELAFGIGDGPAAQCTEELCIEGPRLLGG